MSDNAPSPSSSRSAGPGKAGLLLLLASGCLILFLVVRRAFFPPPMYDSSAHADAWVDANANGDWDLGELPLPGVCIFVDVAASEPPLETEGPACDTASDTFSTDGTGQWPHADDTIGGINFFAGAKCDDLWILAVPPQGYEHTTPPIVNGCEGEFGFRMTQ